VGQYPPNFHVKGTSQPIAFARIRQCLTTLSLTIFTQRNFVADFLQAKYDFTQKNGRFAFLSPSSFTGFIGQRMIILGSLESVLKRLPTYTFIRHKSRLRKYERKTQRQKYYVQGQTERDLSMHEHTSQKKQFTRVLIELFRLVLQLWRYTSEYRFKIGYFAPTGAS